MKQYHIRFDQAALDDLRFTKAGKYTIIYHVNDEKVVIYIYGIFHLRRDIVKILKSRSRS